MMAVLSMPEPQSAITYVVKAKPWACRFPHHLSVTMCAWGPCFISALISKASSCSSCFLLCL